MKTKLKKKNNNAECNNEINNEKQYNYVTKIMMMYLHMPPTPAKRQPQKQNHKCIVPGRRAQVRDGREAAVSEVEQDGTSCLWTVGGAGTSYVTGAAYF